MKLFKLFLSFLITFAVLVSLTACGAAVDDVPADPADEVASDEIEVHVEGDSISGAVTIVENTSDGGTLTFDPPVASGRLVPTGADPLSIVLISSVFGVVAARRRKR